MSEEKKNEMLVTPNAAPSYVDTGSNEGLEDLRAEDIILPMLVQAQSLSPKVVEEEWRSGELRCSLTGDLLAEKEESLEFVPVFHWLEWIVWGDRNASEGIIERSVDPAGALATRCKNGNPPDENGREVTEYHQFAIFFPKFGEQIYAMGCAKTKYRKAQRLLSLARFRPNSPLYAGQYTVRSVLAKNKAGQAYYTFEFANAGWCPEVGYPYAKEQYQAMREAFKAQRLQATVDADAPVGNVSDEM